MASCVLIEIRPIDTTFKGGAKSSQDLVCSFFRVSGLFLVSRGKAMGDEVTKVGGSQRERLSAQGLEAVLPTLVLLSQPPVAPTDLALLLHAANNSDRAQLNHTTQGFPQRDNSVSKQNSSTVQYSLLHDQPKSHDNNIP